MRLCCYADEGFVAEFDANLCSGVKDKLRFPGQYYDGESGMHYNFHRYYDSKIGRYISIDPMGLDGGVNNYSYALNNTLSYKDSKGLIVKYCIRDLDVVGHPDTQQVDPQLHHSFIYVNGMTIGLTTNDPKLSRRCIIEGPGMLDPNNPDDLKVVNQPGYMNGSCQTIDCDSELALMLATYQDPVPHYCLKPGGAGNSAKNCQEWAVDKIKENCKKDCNP